jgi:hypothetical protein
MTDTNLDTQRLEAINVLAQKFVADALATYGVVAPFTAMAVAVDLTRLVADAARDTREGMDSRLGLAHAKLKGASVAAVTAQAVES